MIAFFYLKSEKFKKRIYDNKYNIMKILKRVLIDKKGKKTHFFDNMLNFLTVLM